MAMCRDDRLEGQLGTVVPYQRVLRAVGTYLDRHMASQTFTQQADGCFHVWYQPRYAPGEVATASLDLGELLEAEGRRKEHRPSRTAQGHLVPAGRYEDMLRAIGHELEHAEARHVVLDELDGSYVVTYQRLDPAGGTSIRKHRTIVTATEAEELLNRARSRRSLTRRGWLLRSSDTSSAPVRLVLIRETSLALERLPGVLYEYRMPALTERAAERLQGAGDTSAVYRGGRTPAGKAASDEVLLRSLEAARLIAGIYDRCLDPLRFPGNGPDVTGKEQVAASFARSLTTRKALTAVELVAGTVQQLRRLDLYQDGLGTDTVRWMQYLAAEALEVTGTRPSGILPEQSILHDALRKIVGSVSAVDRFAAMRARGQGA